MLKIISVNESIFIEKTAQLADEIWHQHFSPIIGKDQVNFMLAKFQSESAISEQIESGWLYFLLKQRDEFVGYVGLVPDADNKQLMLSKLYVKQSVRRQGLGKYLLDFVEEKCRSEGYDLLWLTVNRRNHGPIDFYKKLGFTIVDGKIKDIGGGFVMDDYIMQKRL